LAAGQLQLSTEIRSSQLSYIWLCIAEQNVDINVHVTLSDHCILCTTDS